MIHNDILGVTKLQVLPLRTHKQKHILFREIVLHYSSDKKNNDLCAVNLFMETTQ